MSWPSVCYVVFQCVRNLRDKCTKLRLCSINSICTDFTALGQRGRYRRTLRNLGSSRASRRRPTAAYPQPRRKNRSSSSKEKSQSRLGDERIVAKAGTFANMPVGSLHSFKNETDKNAQMIISVAPAGLEEMFIEAGQQLTGWEALPKPSKRKSKSCWLSHQNTASRIRVPKQ